MRSAARSDTRTRNINSTLETMHAAATAIAAVEDRDHTDTPVQFRSFLTQKRRWSGCLSLYWCFGSCKHQTRIGHAIFVPETTNHPSNPVQNQIQSTTISLPFIAPPSSPASFFQSEPPSVTQSPTGLLSTSVSASMFSPNGPYSIFAIGPYSNETQLVSPPNFSPFLTEPSTAPFTPPESFHLNTTPSSPEVPFATTNGGFPFSHYEFPSYQLSPGSPIGHLISPGSVISGSGASSPFPGPIDPNFLNFLANGTPKLLELEKKSVHDHEWSSRSESGSATPDTKKLLPQNGVHRENDRAPEKVSGDNSSEKKRHHFRRRSITLGSSREFDFENIEGDESTKVRIGSAWGANEKVADDNGNGKNWSFPVMQSNVS